MDNQNQNQNQQHRLSAYVSPRLSNSEHLQHQQQQQLSPSGPTKEFRDRELSLGSSSGNLARSLSLGERHTGGGYQPHSSSNLSHSTSNASSHHRLLASPSLNSNSNLNHYNPNSSQYYAGGSSAAGGSRNSDLPLPASASTSSPSYSLLPIVNTQNQSLYNPSPHSSLGIDPQPPGSSYYSPRSPASTTRQQQPPQTRDINSQQQRPHSYFDPSYGPASGAGGGVGGSGMAGQRQSIAAGMNLGGTSSGSSSQWKQNQSSNSRKSSPANQNSNVNVGIGMSDEGSLPTHNNHGIYDLLPTNQSSSGGGGGDSLPYAYNSGGSNLANPIYPSSPSTHSGGQPPPPPQSSNANAASSGSQSQRNSTLGLHSGQTYLNQAQGGGNSNWNSATSPTSSSSTIHGNHYEAANQNQLYQPQSQASHLDSQDYSSNSNLNRNNSNRSSLGQSSQSQTSGGGSGFHRVERKGREPSREVEFRRVRDSDDLRPNLDLAASGKGRRADPMGGYVSVSSFLELHEREELGSENIGLTSGKIEKKKDDY